MRIQPLFETFDNLFIADRQQRSRYAEQVWQLLNTAYAPIGGLRGNGFNNVDDMIDNLAMWKLYRRGNTIKAAMMYKDKHGRKRVAIATDGSKDAKQTLARMILDEYRNGGRSYAEISGKSLQFHRHILGDQQLDDITVPSSDAQQVLQLSDDQFKIIDAHTYQRLISGQWHEKRMVGSPNIALSH